MNARTPGPWEAHKGLLTDQPHTWDVTAKADWSGPSDETPEGWFVATVHEVTSNDSAEANARLIAAAPELLEALEGLLAKYSSKCRAFDCPAAVSAKVAIAKARGDNMGGRHA